MRKEVIVITCDICGHEIQEKDLSAMKIIDGDEFTYGDICKSCHKKIIDYIKHIKREGERNK